jgi:hypothetical protein
MLVTHQLGYNSSDNFNDVFCEEQNTKALVASATPLIAHGA